MRWEGLELSATTSLPFLFDLRFLKLSSRWKLLEHSWLSPDNIFDIAVEELSSAATTRKRPAVLADALNLVVLAAIRGSLASSNRVPTIVSRDSALMSAKARLVDRTVLADDSVVHPFPWSYYVHLRERQVGHLRSVATDALGYQISLVVDAVESASADTLLSIRGTLTDLRLALGQLRKEFAPLARWLDVVVSSTIPREGAHSAMNSAESALQAHLEALHNAANLASHLDSLAASYAPFEATWDGCL